MKTAYKVVRVKDNGQAQSATTCGTIIRYFKDGRLIRAPKHSPRLFVFDDVWHAQAFAKSRGQRCEVWRVAVKRIENKFSTPYGDVFSSHDFPSGTCFVPSLRMVRKLN